MILKFTFLCSKRDIGGRGKIAVIGGGAAGLAATGYLVCNGYEVDVYDKLPFGGGMLSFVIPSYRVSRRGIAEGLEDLEKNFSVKFFYRTKVFCGEKPRRDEGDEFVENVVSLEKIVDNYDAILITTGTWSSRKTGIPGEDMPNVVSALDYVYRWALYEAGYQVKPLIGKRVVVIGGGLSAIDAAELSLERGAHEVYLVYRRTIKEAPAGEYEIRRIIRKGIRWIELAQPTKIIVKNGSANAIEFIRMKLGEPDETGRPRPVPIEGSEFQIEADLIVAAVGETPTPPLEKECIGIKTDGRGRIIINRRMQTGNEKVFAAGDVVNGPTMIGTAIGSGLRASQQIDIYLRSRRYR